MSLSDCGMQNSEDGGARISFVKGTQRIDAILWIRTVLRDICPNASVKDAANLADVLLLGDEWVAGRYYYWSAFSLRAPAFVKIELIEPVDPFLEARKIRDAERCYIDELMTRGADGDAKAAIEYCNAARAGKTYSAPQG